MNEDQSAATTQGAQPAEQPQQNYSPRPPYGTPTPPPRKSKMWIPCGIGCGCSLLLVLFFFLVLVSVIVEGTGGVGEKIALIQVNGVISTGSDSGGLFGSAGAGSESIVRQLEKARRDDDVKAVVLRIDSPGGSPAASEEIYREIVAVKARKPVYCSMGDVAASGGYYVAAPCTAIYADNATITGSIGVIFESTNLAGLFKKIGVDVNVVKSGKFKDIGSPARPMTPEERQMIQSLIDDTFNQFIDAVTNGRKMPRDKVKALATGAVFTGRKAKELGLIDQIGGLRETVVAAAVAGGIKGEPKVSRYSRRGGLFGVFGEEMGLGDLVLRERSLLADEMIRKLTSQQSPSKSIR